MKKLLLFIYLLAISFMVAAQTNVSGGIYQNTTWTASASPYIMTGPVVVFPGVTLTINPGVQIFIQDTNVVSATGDNYLEIRGKLIMKGTKNAPINIEALVHKQQVAAWYGIKILASQGGSIDADYFSLANTNYGFFVDTGVLPDSTTYHHCSWKYNNYAINAFNKLFFDTCTFQNNFNAITGNLLASRNPWIVVNGGSFTGNSVALNPYGSHAIIHHANLNSNQMAISGIGSVTAWQNNFSNNQIAFRGLSGNISNCQFSNNHVAITDAVGLQIKSCNISGSKIACNIGEDCIIDFSTISNNDTGIVISSNLTFSSIYPMIYKNQICNNNFFNVFNASNINLNLGTNCFCGIDSATIEAKLYDGYDDITKGLFNFSIYSQDCSTALRSIQKVNIPNGSLTIDDQKNISPFFPNPVTNNIVLQGVEIAENIMIFDLQGKVMTSIQNSNNIDVSNLVPATYMIVIQSKNNIFKRIFQKI